MSHNVTIASGKKSVQLPNGFAYDAGVTVTLTDEQFASLRSDLFPGTLIDAGGNALTVQGANVTAIATADGSDPATTQALANATKAKVNTLITNLTGAGKAIHV